MLNEYKATIKLGLPIAIGQLGVIIMGFADTMMVGHYSTAALAAASFVNSVFNLVTYLLLGYSYGLTPLIGALYGRQKCREAGTMLKTGIAANTLFATLIIALLTILYFLLPHMGQPEEILPLVRPYFICLTVSVIFVALFNALRQFTDAVTDTKVGMYAILLSNILNILGNALLIYGIGPFPELGLLGAGISTTFSRAVMVMFVLVAICAMPRYAPYRTGLTAGKLRRTLLRIVNARSIPVALQMGMESAAFAISGIMAGWLGALQLAAYQVAVTMSTLGFLVYYSFGSSMSIRIATAYGQRDVHAIHRAWRAGSHVLLALCAIVSLVFALLGMPMARLFTADEEVLAVVATVILPLVLYQLGDAMQVCYSNALRGTGRVRPVMRVALVSYILINLPVAYLFAFVCGWGAKGIFLSFSVGLFTAATLFKHHYKKAEREMAAR